MNTDTYVLALHATKGDPERTRNEFAFLRDNGRNVEYLFFGDGWNAEQQLRKIVARHQQSQIIVAPLLISRGFHYSNELVFAVENVAASNVTLAPLWGESEAFENAVRERLAELALDIETMRERGITWFVPGGPLAAKRVRETIDRVAPQLAGVRQRWISHGAAGALEGSLGIVVVVRGGGKLSALIADKHRHCAEIRELFTAREFHGSIRAWLQRSEQGFTNAKIKIMPGDVQPDVRALV
ncbi:MAG: hypothetical protein L6Q71_10270 [Planctomycetes bacterium]|nr:hypothetical protein [Planctomycetota bacterium]